MRLSIRIIGICIAGFLIPVSSLMADSSEWANIQSAYQSGNYEAALQVLLKQDSAFFQGNPNYYYDLGTIYYQLGRLGLAIGNLEKANRLSPRTREIQANLAIARSALTNKLGTEQIDPASSWADRITDSLSPSEFYAAVGLLGFLVCLLWLNAYMKERSLRKAIAHKMGLWGAVGFACALGLLLLKQSVNSAPPAICIEKQVVRSGPGNHFIEMTRLDEGMKVRILGQVVTHHGENSNSEDWKQIRYSSQGIGWIKASSLLTL